MLQCHVQLFADGRGSDPRWQHRWRKHIGHCAGCRHVGNIRVSGTARHFGMPADNGKHRAAIADNEVAIAEALVLAVHPLRHQLGFHDAFILPAFTIAIGRYVVPFTVVRQLADLVIYKILLRLKAAGCIYGRAAQVYFHSRVNIIGLKEALKLIVVSPGPMLAIEKGGGSANITPGPQKQQGRAQSPHPVKQSWSG